MVRLVTGVLGIICQEIARYAEFWEDLTALPRPDGVAVWTECKGSIAEARNALVRRFLASDAQWLVMVDDDHALPPDFLFRPRTHPIVASVYLTRMPPYVPTLYGPRLPDGSFEVLTLDEVPTHGVVPVYAAGASGMFVTRAVYEAMPAPWYELGQSDHVGEDLWFCHKAQQLGIPVHVDLDTRLGHLAPFAIWPDVQGGQWVTSIRRDEVALTIGAARMVWTDASA